MKHATLRGVKNRLFEVVASPYNRGSLKPAAICTVDFKILLSLGSLRRSFRLSSRTRHSRPTQPP